MRENENSSVENRFFYVIYLSHILSRTRLLFITEDENLKKKKNQNPTNQKTTKNQNQKSIPKTNKQNQTHINYLKVWEQYSKC